jgi:hypothetical protein
MKDDGMIDKLFSINKLVRFAAAKIFELLV